ncbi:hypothetical protein [Methylobacterium sp.]
MATSYGEAAAASLEKWPANESVSSRAVIERQELCSTTLFFAEPVSASA